jgi:hypothetical protein
MEHTVLFELFDVTWHHNYDDYKRPKSDHGLLKTYSNYKAALVHAIFANWGHLHTENSISKSDWEEFMDSLCDYDGDNRARKNMWEEDAYFDYAGPEVGGVHYEYLNAEFSQDLLMAILDWQDTTLTQAPGQYGKECSYDVKRVKIRPILSDYPSTFEPEY